MLPSIPPAVPRDIIDRNLGKGAADAADYKEVVYEVRLGVKKSCMA